MRAFLIAAALFAAAPAFAQSSTTTTLSLADAATAPSRTTVIDGAAWRCEGATCTATGGASQPATRACRRAVARLGAVSAFTYKGVTLSDADLATCNAG
ncbi:MAG: hypothetical protein EON88_16175 [Brevundimonas sp.]|uniref:CC_3452 family protein n=1 Tax=Brevundimonas sp. Leaf363 TaxID=1736353 RepID=UPI0006F465E6|nr:hypothetical protein [Brevundimonas sp. Leaf363]KQS56157.1 hypothetical protein ASG17_09030 [Brevundimonas sp. Leaf363]RZJ92905.1 MAG: hypothetical protein EON88_16175 [Brevundimonas sp.]